MKEQHVLIDFIKQSKIKNLTNVELLNELPFYSGLKDTPEVLLYEIKGLNIRLVLRIKV